MQTDILRDESKAPADIPGLVAQARAAYQQNRIKECLALTKAALLLDPGNAAALEMQSAVRFDMQRDLSDARALIEESRTKQDGQKYRKAAEIILLKSLYLDPDSDGAKTLLSSIRASSETSSASAPSSPSPAPAAPIASVVFAAPPPTVSAPPAYVPPVIPEPPAKPADPAPAASVAAPESPIVFAPSVVREPLVVDVPQPEDFFEGHVPGSPVVFSPHGSHESPAYREEPVTAVPPAHRTETIMASNVMKPEVSVAEPVPFTVGTSYIEKPGYMKNGKKKGSRSNLAVPVTLVVIAVIGAGLFFARQKLGTNAAASTTSETAPKFQEQSVSKVTPYSAPAAAAAPAPKESSLVTSTPTKPTLAAMNTPPPLPNVSPSVPPVDVAPAVNPKTAAAAPAPMGSLAVSCAIAAEIYMGNKLLGSTPTTLQLPAGNQTLEYRHGDLRSVVTHTIKSKETTTALITFDVTVQVNARPWATVFIEGSPRQQLGQTPLSDVRLPVGSVLVLENPNFPSKSHKIVADDKTIQMVFP